MAEELKNEQLNEEELEQVNGGGSKRPGPVLTQTEGRTEGHRK